MKKYLIAFMHAACAACASPADSPQALELAAPPTGGCYDPASYGAVPDDGVDDSAAIQAAVDAAGAAGGGTVCVGPGRFLLSRASVHAFDRFAAVGIHWPHVTLRGAGDRETILYVEGDQGAGALMVIDVYQVDDVAVRDLAIDTSGTFNTDEQTHAIRVLGPADGFDLQRVRFNHPHPSTRSGDCLNLIGNGPVPPATSPQQLVTNVRVANANFDVCARSGVMVQRGVQGLLVTGSRFGTIGDTPIDFEPTSYGVVSDINITNNMFLDLAAPGAGYAVTVGGWDGPARRIVFSGNVMSKRGVSFYRSSDVTMVGNTITSASGRLVTFENTANNIVVSGNVLHETAVVAPTPPDYVLYFSNHGTASGGAANVIVEGNSITNDNLAGGVAISGATDFTFSHNHVIGTVAAPAYIGLYVTPSIFDVDNTQIDGNLFESPAWRSAVWITQLSSAYPYHFGRVSVIGNTSRGTGTGLTCLAPATTYTKPLVSSANNWDGVPLSCAATVTAGN